jgi:hypothetical protein
VKGFFFYSLLDSFEWADGYSFRFGLIRVDFNDDTTRQVKKSYMWAKNRIVVGGIEELPLPGPRSAEEVVRPFEMESIRKFLQYLTMTVFLGIAWVVIRFLMVGCKCYCSKPVGNSYAVIGEDADDDDE